MTLRSATCVILALTLLCASGCGTSSSELLSSPPVDASLEGDATMVDASNRGDGSTVRDASAIDGSIGDGASTDGALADGATDAEPPKDASGSEAGSGNDAGPDGGAACTTDTWTSYAQLFLATNCIDTCHTTHKHAFNGPLTQTKVISNRTSMSGRIQNSTMPPSPGPGFPSGLNATDKERILRWLNCGANP